MKRGEIWWAELDTPAGRCPVLLLSRNETYMVRSLVTIAPITTRIRNIPSEVQLDIVDGMPQKCVVNLDTITTISKESLHNYLTSLNQNKLEELEAAIHFSLGLIFSIPRFFGKTIL
ncbi:MAG: type II toxin-antitoxin system PemK/MazF family toxin [Chloroflexi bacterium]|nr:type II toxin-antitoxin system PemK/MazF family toxin [Chloroflexota bacterium]